MANIDRTGDKISTWPGMNKIFWLPVAAAFAVSAGFAQETPALPAVAPATSPLATNISTNAAAATLTNKPASVKKSPAKPSHKSAAAEPQQTGPPVIVGPAMARQNNVNVRGKAAINSEVLGRLKKGDHVEVLEIVTKPLRANEPDKWARIPLPTNTAIWVHSDYVDATNKTVKSRRLNLRGGPSEDHSVVGRLEKGAAIKEVEIKGDWIRIEPAPGAYGFVAAHLLMPATAPVEVAKTATPTATNATALAETKIETPAPAAPPDELKTTPGNATTTNAVEVAKTTPETQEEIKRVVSREGIVKRSVSIQAPSWFVLESPRNGRTINYLHTPNTNVALRGFFGQRVTVTGEEGLDERWPNTPVINVESIEVVP